MKEFLKKHGQVIFNIYLFINFASWGGWRAYKAFDAGTLNYVELSVIIQSVIVAVIILSRKPYQSIDTSLFEQMIALLAFFSGAALFREQPTTG